MEEDIVFQDKYLVGRKLGAGSFGSILLGTDLETGKYVAIKFEKSSLNKSPQLPYEAKVMRNLTAGPNPVFGVPKIHWLAMESEFNIMVMDLLGPSLADLFNYCGKRFTLKTTLMIADQMLQRIEQIHKKNYIHRDIKPDNFLVGLGKESYIVNIIDFGLAKKFRDIKSQQHIPYRENRNLTGTARYASLNAHLGIEQSRRDDLEAIGFCLVYFLQGKLPWQNLQANNRAERYAKIAEIKLRSPIEHICEHLPLEISNFMHYVRALRFEDRPDYQGVRTIFKQLLIKEGHEYDHLYDWVMINQQHLGSKIFSVESFDEIIYNSSKHQKPLKTESIEGNADEEEKKEEGKVEGQQLGGLLAQKSLKPSIEELKSPDSVASPNHHEADNHLNESNVNDVSQVTNNGLLEETAVKKAASEEDKNKGGLINRLGLLESAKPQKKFLMINNGLTAQVPIEESEGSKKKTKKGSHKHKRKGDEDEKCIIF